MEAIFDDEAQVNCAIEAEPDPKASTDFTRLKAIGETSLGAASVESENSDADCSPLAFSYQPLKESDGIRLVLIHPAPDVSAHLECSIQHATLSQYDQDLMNHYHALSYVWGDATNTRKITVEGYPIQVTVTLESALRRLRDRERIIRVWADALCINQADTDERNQQVRQMGTVYSVARHTVIDLGEGSEETDSILDQLAGFGTVGNIPVPKHVLRDRYGDTKLKALADGLKEQILGRPWFSRVWVFQELLLSQDPWVQCGSKRLKWESLCHFLRVFRSNGKSEYTLGGRPKQGGSNASMELDALQRLEGLEEARLNFQQHLVGRGEGNSLLSLLSSRRGLGVTDPRDMIYAHFGIMSDTFPGHLKNEVDYSKSVIELYTEIALYLFHKYKDCRMLTFVEDTDPLKRLRGLPSWVPDWTLRGPGSGQVHRLIQSYSVIPNFGFRFSAKGQHELLCAGRIIGRIGQVGKNVLNFGNLTPTETWDSWLPYLQSIPRDWVPRGEYQGEYSASTLMTFETMEKAIRFDELVHQVEKIAGLEKFCLKRDALWSQRRLCAAGHYFRHFNTKEGKYSNLKLHPAALIIAMLVGIKISIHGYQILKNGLEEMLILEGKRVCESEPVHKPDAKRVTDSRIGLVTPGAQTGDFICDLYCRDRRFVFRPMREYEIIDEEAMIYCTFIGQYVNGDYSWETWKHTEFVIS